MADPRIIKVELDEDTILWRNADIEQERRIASFALIEDNVWEIRRQGGEPLEMLILGLARFRRPVRDYFAICDSYYQAIRKATAAEIETIDMARRGLHNEAAELLMERLNGKIEVDFATARRLFTLIAVLHIRG